MRIGFRQLPPARSDLQANQQEFMNTNETQKMKPDEAGFLTALVAIELIIIPLLGGALGKYGGGIAMAVTAVIGVIAYLLFFGERLRKRGQMKLISAVVASSLVLSAMLVLVSRLLREYL
jgi:hypothetical protein